MSFSRLGYKKTATSIWGEHSVFLTLSWSNLCGRSQLPHAKAAWWRGPSDEKQPAKNVVSELGGRAFPSQVSDDCSPE